MRVQTQLWLAMLTFLYVDFLDTTGTLFSMANFMNNFIPGAALPDSRTSGLVAGKLSYNGTNHRACRLPDMVNIGPEPRPPSCCRARKPRFTTAIQVVAQQLNPSLMDWNPSFTLYPTAPQAS